METVSKRGWKFLCGDVGRDVRRRDRPDQPFSCSANDAWLCLSLLLPLMTMRWMSRRWWDDEQRRLKLNGWEKMRLRTLSVSSAGNLMISFPFVVLLDVMCAMVACAASSSSTNTEISIHETLTLFQRAFESRFLWSCALFMRPPPKAERQPVSKGDTEGQ